MVTRSMHLIGFDDIMNQILKLNESAKNSTTSNYPSYPPYSLYKYAGNVYLEFAVAGFTESELDVFIENDMLYVNGTKAESEDDDKCHQSTAPVYIHRGIAKRNFRLAFSVNPRYDLVDATLQNGILKIELKDTGYKKQSIKIKTHTESSKHKHDGDSRQLLNE